MSDTTQPITPSTDASGACSEPDCMETLRELDVFLDGELSTEARDSIRHHLDCCPDCNHAFDFHAELKTVIQKKCLDEEMPADLLSRIEQCFDTDFDDDGTVG
ncbi:MAG: zf-HC2 domain-containing protein, partial [Actinomycetota bacterium]